MSHARYDAYKDSGIEWLGEVPAHWGIKRIKDITLVKRGASPRPIDDPVYFDEKGDYSWVRIADLTASERYLLNTKEKLSTLGASLSVKRYPGDFILSIAGTVGKPIISKIKCCIHDGFVWFPTLKMNPEFLYYIFSTGLPYQGLGKLGTQLNLNTETVGLISIPTPSASEIERIVQHLDTKTAQLDRKIELLGQKAAQYGKLKQSLINETVTRGLDKNVAMKDSGVEWVGEVPVHWKVQRVADIAVQNKVKNCGLEEKNLLSLSYGRIIRKDFNTSFGLLPESFETYQVVTAGAIILRLTDLQNDKKSLRVGLVREHGIITSAYIGLRFQRSIDSTFAYYLLHVYDLSKVFYWFGGGLRSTMRFDDIKVIPFILPPLAEQQAIAAYLDEKTAHIDRIVATINTQIDKLKELRKTLINDIVTGKICIVEQGGAGTLVRPAEERG